MLNSLDNPAPAPRWQVWLDWAGSGSRAPGVDLSDDVLGLRWRAGRRGLPVPEFAPPATLELALRNHDHRYTPGHPDGSRGAGLRPGRPIRLRAGWSYDDFATTGAAPVDLHGRRAASGLSRWAVAATAGNGFAVLNGVVRGSIGRGRPSHAVALLDTGDPLATLTVRYRRASNGLGGFALRCAAPNDCLRLRFTAAASRLERISGRRITLLATGLPLAAAVWYDLEIAQTYDGISVSAVNLAAAGAVRRTILTASGLAEAPTSGRHGLWHAYRSTADRWGDFSVGRTLFTGHLTGIAPDYAAGVCRLTAADPMRRLESARLYRALPGGPMRSGHVAAAILDWAGLSPADYALDDGRLLLSGGPRPVWDVAASRALRRLQREEHGLIYADGLGRIRLEAAQTRAAVRSHDTPTQLSRFSIADTARRDGPYAAALRRNDGADAVERAVTFRYRRLADAGRRRVWLLNETLAVNAGAEWQLLAASDEWAVIDDVAAPVAHTDYTATDDAAGRGADVTDDITVELLTPAASGIAGRGRLLRIHNAGSQTAYLQTLQLYANHCWRSEGATACRASTPPETSSEAPSESPSEPPAAAPSQAPAAAPSPAAPDTSVVSSTRPGVVRCHYTDHYAAAQSGAAARLAARSRQRPQLEITLPLSAPANWPAIVEGRLSDVITVPAGAPGRSTAWLLEGMAVDVAGGGAGEARWWLTGV